MSLSQHNFPTVITIFGATGDLMGKKIVPALFDLYAEQKLPKLCSIVGFSRRKWSHEEFRIFIGEIVQHYKGSSLSKELLISFTKHFFFVSGDVEQQADYAELGRFLGQIDGEWKTCANKLFYLAIAPEFFKTTFNHLHASHLTDPCSPEEGWTRIIVEKPFGKDATTAEELDLLLGTIFKEQQIYRIDHYLAKEMIQNILAFRFSNNLFEQNWSNETIESIQLKLWETLGVEERGAFYDKVGTLRDVGQNHLLQMLAFITMEEPLQLKAEFIRKKRAEVLNTLPPLTPIEVKKNTFRAQYEGYKTIKNVDPQSATETYFKIKTELNSPRWQGVEVVLESGKRMGEARKEIVVNFKHPMPCLCPSDAPEHFQNRVIFSMEPQEEIKIEFWSKKPGLEYKLEKRSFDFALREDIQKKQYVEEYKKLVLDCINGDQTLFVSTDEMRAMWRFVDPIVNVWHKNTIPLLTYKPDTFTISEETKFITSKESLRVMPTEIAIIGLGKMGGNLARHLAEQNWKVIGYNRSEEVTKKLAEEGITPVFSLKELLQTIKTPRVIWLMLTAGEANDHVLFDKKEGLINSLKKGDIVIDGGNSFYKDALRRYAKLKKKGIHFVDVGTSGGPGGARTGACLMIGGEEKIFHYLEPLFKAASKNGSYQFFPGIGAGHFVKMIHNGIEYGMMQAIAEGFEILKKAKFKLNLKDVTKIYNNGSVIDSRLIKWLAAAFELHGEDLKDVSGTVAHTGEGAWTVKAAQELKVKAKIIDESLKFRIHSKKDPKGYTGKVLSALREQFGGHKVS
jgi:glucose-6-phosphate 1-dehydrogenase